MTEEAIKRQIEVLEMATKEICKSPESARAYLRELKASLGMPLDKISISGSKKKK
jgi:hypothetical protein